ncbi:MAG: methionine--tRNA ligase subunit beta [Deltaproteobacteria bacterium]|nr:methionine--tRNA ligase subunit beta [Deltaproteobacteria bacterium]
MALRHKRLYLTTAIDYVNSLPHIGTAYEKIGADVIARFARLQGSKVRFQMGNDEPSVNVRKAAEAQGLDPLAYCDGMAGAFTNVWQRLNISYDGFIRTTNAAHRRAVTACFRSIAKGKTPRRAPNIYKKPYAGWYCDACEAFYQEKEMGEGRSCPTHRLPTQWVEEENYFFALSHYQEWLASHLRRHPEFILPEVRRNEITKLIASGLEDVSISRMQRGWGIPGRFASWWKQAEVVHIIGKDITRFHCVIWPAMLKAAGLSLPRTIFSHGFVYQRGEKMSKTLGNVVDPLQLVERFGADPVRYFLLRENSFGRDADFTWERFIERYNSDLANGIGNLVNRTVGMIHRYCQGTVRPARAAPKGLPTFAGLRKGRARILKTMSSAFAIDRRHDDLAFHEALSAIWALMTDADQYINDTAPWERQKRGESEAVAFVLYQVVEAIRILAVGLSPFCPETAERIWAQMGLDAAAPIAAMQWRHLVKFAMLKKPVMVRDPRPLFPRIEQESKISPQAPSHKARGEERGTMESELIDIADFAKLDLRIATVTAAEQIEGTDKLLKLQVDLGTEQRQLVAGIAKHYPPEELIGRQIVVVANLKPAKLRGVESQGMLLAASQGEQLSIVSPQREVPNGARVK